SEDGSFTDGWFESADASYETSGGLLDESEILESTEPSASEPTFVPELATDTPSLEPSLRVLEGKLARGETLSQALSGDGVSGELVHGIARAMARIYDFRKARPGQSYRLDLEPAARPRSL